MWPITGNPLLAPELRPEMLACRGSGHAARPDRNRSSTTNAEAEASADPECASADMLHHQANRERCECTRRTCRKRKEPDPTAKALRPKQCEWECAACDRKDAVAGAVERCKDRGEKRPAKGNRDDA